MTFTPRMASSRIPLKLSQFAKLLQPSGTCSAFLSQPHQEWCNKIKLLRHLFLRARQFYLSSDLLTFQSWREYFISSKLFFGQIQFIGVVVNKSLLSRRFLVVMFSKVHILESTEATCNIILVNFNSKIMLFQVSPYSECLLRMK